MGYVRAKAIIGDPGKTILEEVEFLADSGAFFPAVSPSLAKRLNLTPITETELILADKRTAKATLSNAYFRLLDREGVFQVAMAGKHFYKLVPTGRAPTLEIDGIRMHRTSGTSPDQDTGTKLDVLELDGGRVLDTCMGLGYTAIESARRGAELVVTVELEPQVVRIALMNPWSAPLFTDEAIHKVIGDTYTVASILPESFFDYVIHDPPRHDHAGHLYGLDYYRRLHRLMAPGGRMFHYTGEPRSRYRGVNLQRGVSRRLREAGFSATRYHPEVMGVTCVR